MPSIFRAPNLIGGIGGGGVAAARKALQAAGYAGEKVVVPNPADVSTVVLGRFYILSAYHRQLTGLLESTSPYPWNLRWS